MNIIKREFKANRKSLLIWTIALVLIVFVGLYEFKASVSDGQSFYKEMFDSMPKAVRALLGISQFDIGTLMGYFSMLQIYIIILVAIQAGMLGANIITKEEKHKYSDFLMVKPIKREKIFMYKIISALTIIIILNIFITLTSYITYLSIANTYTGDVRAAVVPNYSKDISIIFALELGLLFLQLLFLTLGFLFASIFKNYNKIPTYITAVILSLYFIQFFSSFFSELEFLSYINPLQFFNINLKTHVWIMQFIAIIIAFIFCYLISIKYYRKRDL